MKKLLSRIPVTFYVPERRVIKSVTIFGKRVDFVI